MMPQLLQVRVQHPGHRSVRIWVPVLLVVLGLSPVVVLAVLAAVVACLVYRVSVVRALGAGWRVISAVPGTRVDVEQGRAAVPDQLEALVENLDEMTVEVDSPDAKVRVFCE